MDQLAREIEEATEEMKKLTPEQAAALRPDLDQLLETFARFERAFEKRAKQIEAERN